MKKLLILLLVPLFAMSQTNPNREYWQTNKWTAKKGMNAEFESGVAKKTQKFNNTCLLYTSPSPRDRTRSRMPSSA